MNYLFFSSFKNLLRGCIIDHLLLLRISISRVISSSHIFFYLIEHSILLVKTFINNSRIIRKVVNKRNLIDNSLTFNRPTSYSELLDLDDLPRRINDACVT